MKPILELVKQNGITTIRAITDELNKLKIPTYRNTGIWYVSTVYKLMVRIRLQAK